MGEEIMSMISNGEATVIEEVSDSNSSTHSAPASKRGKCGNSICTSRFKGVVPQQNGHWGCQIYANHQRIWLGTFKSEKDAAMAYDSAAIKLRSGDSRRNFPLSSINVEEPKFQSYFSTEAVLNMIKDGSYQSKFTDYMRTRSQNVETELSLRLMSAQSNSGLTCRQLFQKELTPSDVGKLNRLVIPKKYAVKYFPRISETIEENASADKADDMQLAFYDRSMRLWKFRYCYWSSSQSYVFTRGWNRFVKEKQLKANDTINICLCECRENTAVTQTFYMIDVIHGENSNRLVAAAAAANQQIDMEVEVQCHRSSTDGDVRESKEEGEEEGLTMGVRPTQDKEKAGFKLFGIQII